MPFYQTEYVLGLSTGKPIVLEVSESDLERLEYQKALAKDGRGSPFIGKTVEEVTIGAEFSFFPSYKEVLKIGCENGFTTELITQILRDFGATIPFIQKLLSDNEFISSAKRWFEGVTRDGGRSIRTLMMVYNSAIYGSSFGRYPHINYSPEGQTEWKQDTEQRPVGMA